MPSCTFFGHSTCPDELRPKLKAEIVNMFQNNNVTMFYVGNHGNFDALARSILRELNYPYAVTLAYLPENIREYEDYSDTMFPEGIETVPKRFAIAWRNRWMIENSNFVITYITHDWGGASQFAQLAKKRGKIIRNIAELP